MKAKPGTIQEVEYEVERNGVSSREFNIVNHKGVKTKVEVDTATEEWEIGEEADAKPRSNYQRPVRS